MAGWLWFQGRYLLKNVLPSLANVLDDLLDLDRLSQETAFCLSHRTINPNFTVCFYYDDEERCCEVCMLVLL